MEVKTIVESMTNSLVCMSYVEHVLDVLSLIEGVECNNYELYCHFLYNLGNLFSSFNSQIHEKYLVFFHIFFATIKITRPATTFEYTKQHFASIWANCP